MSSSSSIARTLSITLLGLALPSVLASFRLPGLALPGFMSDEPILSCAMLLLVPWVNAAVLVELVAACFPSARGLTAVPATRRRVQRVSAALGLVLLGGQVTGLTLHLHHSEFLAAGALLPAAVLVLASLGARAMVYAVSRYGIGSGWAVVCLGELLASTWPKLLHSQTHQRDPCGVPRAHHLAFACRRRRPGALSRACAPAPAHARGCRADRRPLADRAHRGGAGRQLARDRKPRRVGQVRAPAVAPSAEPCRDGPPDRHEPLGRAGQRLAAPRRVRVHAAPVRSGLALAVVLQGGFQLCLAEAGALPAVGALLLPFIVSLYVVRDLVAEARLLTAGAIVVALEPQSVRAALEAQHLLREAGIEHVVRGLGSRELFRLLAGFVALEVRVHARDAERAREVLGALSRVTE